MARRRGASDRSDRLRSLIAEHQPAIARYAQRRLPASEIDDLVAEVFAAAWRRIDDLPEGDRALPWLYGVAHNKLAHRRRTWARAERLRQKIGRMRVTQEGPGDQLAAVDLIASAARRLSFADRELLRLISWEHLATSELAEALGCSENAAAIRVHRMRRRLEQHLAELDEDHAPAGPLGHRPALAHEPDPTTSKDQQT